MASTIPTSDVSEPADVSERQRPAPADEHGDGRRRRDTLARTGPLLALLIPIFLVYGLATLSGYTTDTGVLIIAVIALLLATFAVILGVIKLASVPPEDEDEEGDEPS
jgi:hypothetical protein